MAKQKRARTARREAARASVKLARERERLFALDWGGSATRPISVETPAVIEGRARGTPCPLCDGEHQVLEHAAVSTEHGALREVRIQCRLCGSRRSLWFRVTAPN